MYQTFTPVDWCAGTTIYEVNLRQYTAQGSFRAFAKELPRLRDMGIETLWFMPVTPISLAKRQGTLGSYYACSDYVSVNPEFGTLEDFKDLVAKAHAAGFKVIMDWVANHTGWDHVWTRTHPGYYNKNAAGEFYDTNGWHDVIDLNYYDQQMRGDMISAMTFWVQQCDIDGFRCDMAHLVPLDFWRQARMALDAVKPLFWLGETENMQYLDVFDCCYAWAWMHQCEKLAKGEAGLPELLNVMKRYNTDLPAGKFAVYFTSNHDENSWNGTEYEKYGPAAAVLAVLGATWNGIPLIYSGQELPNYKRLKFFEKDTILWTGENRLHDFYKSLLSLRRQHAAVKAGAVGKPYIIPIHGDQYVLAFLRREQGQDLLVLLNLSANHLFVQLPDGYVHGVYKDIFNGVGTDIIPHYSFELKPWGYKVMTK